ncbi:hypothetical protein ACRAWF_21340 [Streptomyces sp. L7]
MTSKRSRRGLRLGRPPQAGVDHLFLQVAVEPPRSRRPARTAATSSPE